MRRLRHDARSRCILIGGRHRFAAGNWKTGEEQTTFTGSEDAGLSALVLPPDIDPAVYVLRRDD